MGGFDHIKDEQMSSVHSELLRKVSSLRTLLSPLIEVDHLEKKKIMLSTKLQWNDQKCHKYYLVEQFQSLLDLFQVS